MLLESLETIKRNLPKHKSKSKHRISEAHSVIQKTIDKSIALCGKGFRQFQITNNIRNPMDESDYKSLFRKS